MLGCAGCASAASFDSTPTGKISRVCDVRTTIQAGVNEDGSSPLVDPVNDVLTIRINYNDWQIVVEALHVIIQRNVSMADHRAWCFTGLVRAGLYLNGIANNDGADVSPRFLRRLGSIERITDMGARSRCRQS